MSFMVFVVEECILFFDDSLASCSRRLQFPLSRITSLAFPKDFQKESVQLIEKLPAEAPVIHFVPKELGPQTVDGNVYPPQLGQVSGLRGQFFFQEQAPREVAEAGNLPCYFLSRFEPGIAILGAFFAQSLQVIHEMRQDHRQRTVFQSSDAATPIQQPGKAPIPKELPFTKTDQSRRGFPG